MQNSSIERSPFLNSYLIKYSEHSDPQIPHPASYQLRQAAYQSFFIFGFATTSISDCSAGKESGLSLTLGSGLDVCRITLAGRKTPSKSPGYVQPRSSQSQSFLLRDWELLKAMDLYSSSSTFWSWLAPSFFRHRRRTRLFSFRFCF